MPYGRGGAGNIQAIAQENARVSADIEANQQATRLDHKGLLPADRLPNNEQQYAHSGRGGAGNYYSLKDLTATGHFSDAHRSHIVGDGTQPPIDAAGGSSGRGAPSLHSGAAPSGYEATRKIGRGGAGNYAFGANESEEYAARQRVGEEQRKEQVKADVERGVKEMLAEPPKAKLAGGEPFE